MPPETKAATNLSTDEISQGPARWSSAPVVNGPGEVRSNPQACLSMDVSRPTPPAADWGGSTSVEIIGADGPAAPGAGWGEVRPEGTEVINVGRPAGRSFEFTTTPAAAAEPDS